MRPSEIGIGSSFGVARSDIAVMCHKWIYLRGFCRRMTILITAAGVNIRTPALLFKRKAFAAQDSLYFEARDCEDAANDLYGIQKNA